MAENKHIKRTITGLERVKTWQLVLLLVLVAFIAATFLRLNNIGMVQRREAVEVADKEGNGQVIVQRLYDLQQYVSSHMNTDLNGGVILEYSYKRDYQAAIDAASNDSNPNGNIYKKADQFCAPQFAAYSNAYLQCFLSQLQKYPAADELTTTVKLPSESAYVHNYISPAWTPDFAGWSVLACIVLILLIIVRLITLALLRLLLYRHYKSV